MKKVLLLLTVLLGISLTSCEKKEQYDISTITYKTVGDQELKLDIYEPSKDIYKVRPAAIFVHGGSFVIGTRNGVRSGVRQLIMDDLLEQGFVVVSVDYRLLDGSTWFPSNIEDVSDSIHFVISNAEELKVNPDRLGIWGTSAGALLAMNVAYNSDFTFEWVIDLYGISDLLTLPEFDLKNVFDEDTTIVVEGNLYSPVTYIDNQSPKTLIIHGSADQVVPIAQSYELRDKLLEHEVPVTLLEYKGFVHGLLGLTKKNEEEILLEVRTFVN